MADTEYTREQALEVATLFRSFTKSSHRWHDGRPLHLVAADMLEHLAAIPAASLREQQIVDHTEDMMRMARRWHSGLETDNSLRAYFREFNPWVYPAPSSEGDEGSGSIPLAGGWGVMREGEHYERVDEGSGGRKGLTFDPEYVHGYLSELLVQTVGKARDPHIRALMQWLLSPTSPPNGKTAGVEVPRG